MTYKNITDEPITVGGPPLTIPAGESADLTERQEHSPQARMAIQSGRLVLDE